MRVWQVQRWSVDVIKNKEKEDESGEVKLEDIGDPVELKGTISTSGRILDEIDLKWWRSQIGLVQQEPFLFNDTIYGNVARGLISSQWEDKPIEQKRKLVEEACKESFADEFIRKLPKVRLFIKQSQRRLTLKYRVTTQLWEMAEPNSLVVNVNESPLPDRS